MDQSTGACKAASSNQLERIENILDSEAGNIRGLACSIRETYASLYGEQPPSNNGTKSEVVEAPSGKINMIEEKATRISAELHAALDEFTALMEKLIQ